MSFVRARTEEQRGQRRTMILDTAVQLLSDNTRVADLSLNELARRVGLAKSNVLRYFETREAVLLALLVQQYDAWLDAVESELADSGRDNGADVDHDGNDAIERVADVISRTISDRPVLCELIANSGTVLEHNVSAEVAADYKRGAYAQAMRLITVITARTGELDEPSQLALAGAINLGIGGAWGMCRPSPALRAAYQQYPELASMRLDFGVAVREFVATVLTGLAHRPVADIRSGAG